MEKAATPDNHWGQVPTAGKLANNADIRALTSDHPYVANDTGNERLPHGDFSCSTREFSSRIVDVGLPNRTFATAFAEDS